jgi:hypothetical protein
MLFWIPLQKIVISLLPVLGEGLGMRAILENLA